MAETRSSFTERLTGRVAVLLPLPLSGAYDYLLPDGESAAPGALVRVPLGTRMVFGVLWGPGSGAVEAKRLKPVGAVLELPPLGDALRRFVDWVASYTLAPPGAVLRMVLSVPAALEPPRPQTVYTAGAERPERMTPHRERVFSALADGPPRPAAELAREAGVGTGVVRALAKDGFLRSIQVDPSASWPAPDPDRPGPLLSPEQAAATETLNRQVAARAFAVTALDGVTGSGKTEVYFEAVAEALRGGRQALVLLPEIALGAQWLARFEDRFGARPAEWHSDLTGARRRDTWRAVAQGRVNVVVGARSALFLPYPDLGVIVVDEEHDGSYKQEDGVIYNARDMAVVRARLSDIPVALVSATPSLETEHNVATGRYDHVHLPKRHGGAKLPTVSVVDMRATPPARGHWISPPLAEAMGAALERAEQGLLFLNRRGYAPLTLCRACGHRLQCVHCTAWLVEHRLSGELRCHHCGFTAPLPTECRACGEADSLVACGPGVERLAEEVAALFPGRRAVVMASDTVTGPRDAEALVTAMLEHRIDILIGTQMAAKGHHFPDLTVVGVIDADLGLAGGDLRAGERTYQLLSQVAGRAGRAARPGHAFLQTYVPEHPVMKAIAAGDRTGFVAAELSARKDAGLPPFGRLAAVIVSGPDEAGARAAAAALGRHAPRRDGIEVLGPAPAPLALLRGRYRYRLLLKTDRETAIQGVARRWLATVSWPRAVRVQVDIDPYSFV